MLIGFSVAHSFEDFVYGVPARFGFSLAVAASLTGMLYAVQAALIAFAVREYAWSFLANAFVGLVWLAAAVMEHGRDLLFVSPYREGAISKVFVVGVLISGLLLALAGYGAWRARRRPPEIRWRQRPGAL